MLRPPRSRKRFEGHADGTGATSLSNPYAEADGRRMRRRYALYGALCLLVLAGLIALIIKTPKGKSSSHSSASGTYTMESQATIDTVGVAKILKHKKSGLQVMVINPADQTQDATFGIFFRTVPENNHGASHVVEHALLAGSVNFPIKDPFNQLKRGSLLTYLDTWTTKDRTAFMLSSRNKQDFANGITVLADAVFNPLMLDEANAWIFRQEGWRLELVNNQYLLLNGNALNDAKAAQMVPMQALINYLYKELFPDHPYSYNQRGDVRNIVSLTHGELIDFYKRNYHPANGKAFCYGPDDYVDVCLDVLEPYLDEYTDSEQFRQDSKVHWQELKGRKSNKDKIPYPSYEDKNDFRVATAWILNDQPMDPTTEVAIFLLVELLVGSPTASLSKTLMDLEVGDDIISLLETSLQQWVLILGVSGIKQDEQVDSVITAINEKLLSLAQNGFADDDVKAAINKLQIRFREQTSSDMPLGVRTFTQVLSHWTYDRDPKQSLFYYQSFEQIKEHIETNGQGLLLELLTRRVVDNQHKLTIELFPSTNLLNVYAQQEQSWLDNLDQFVTKEEGLQMLRETGDLKKKQGEPDSEELLDKIPRLSIKDLRKQPYEIPVQVNTNIFNSGITMLTHALPSTNGLAYIDFAIDISQIAFQDVVLLPLFCNLLMEAGTERKNPVTFRRDIDMYTGGVWVFPMLENSLDVDSAGGYVIPSGYNMITKIIVGSVCFGSTGGTQTFNIIKEILFDTNIENSKMKVIQILKRMIDDMEDDLQSRGYLYTTYRIASQYSLPGFVDEQWKGVTQLLKLRMALNQAYNSWESLRDRLVSMYNTIKKGHRSGMFLSITGDKQAIKDISGAIEVFVVDTLPAAAQTEPFPDFAKVEHPWTKAGLDLMKQEIDAESAYQAFIVPSRVNHVAKGGIFYDVGERMKGSDLVIMQYIGGNYLYDKVRFGLGAADAWAGLDINAGSVTYQSVNDPTIVETLEIYEQGASWLWEQFNGFTELPAEAEGAVVGAIGTMDGTALQPHRVGYISLVQYLTNDSPQSRQLWRDEILGATVSDFMKMVDRLGSWGKTAVAVVTNQKLYDNAVTMGFNATICNYTGVVC